MKNDNTDGIKQSSFNIGTLGHIDHGKTSLVRALTNVWADKHSESLKRNMTIKLGYADMIIRKCSGCEGSSAYTTMEKCPSCGTESKPLMRVSVLDAPGHETLMATAIAEANIINGLLFVIAANEPCPMQQTKEHLMVINLLGIKNVLIIQSKIDIVGKAGAIESYNQIKKFVKGSVIEDAPIIPVMTNYGINIDVVLDKIANMPKPDFDPNASPKMYVARSFDINRPGIEASDMSGGVIGGTLISGRLKVGDEIEIMPGILVQGQKKNVYKPIVTVITGINNGADDMDEALPGGLIGLSTEIDPSFTKADGLVGNIAGRKGELPESLSKITMKYHKLNRGDLQEGAMSNGEALILSVGTATVVGFVKSVKRDNVELELKKSVPIEKGLKIAIMRNISQRWRLTGYGIF